ncbi:MAG: hypothetical protein AVDCRST_MAG21-1214 [uncultured Nocardioidaceae bacterium]|uniref:EamA domain-containing protein n=1 Tax=uncultured Nocardioidaceae bacterium TaxID=253824 RepID=A0A6J4N2D9_9ACTN|nr:MAG: hypothetical protein AVDCRST_MAG21-1214 [uncultured Nocardioidaceae bacterium]
MRDPHQPPLGSLLLLTVGVAGVSLSGPLMAAAATVPALAMSLWRSALGALVILPFSVRTSTPGLRALPRQVVVRSCFAGLMLAVHFAAWTTALKYTSVASATALVCLQAAWVVVLSFLAGEGVVPRVWLGLGFAFAGVLVVSGVDFTVSVKALTGDMLALVGGMFSAVYTVIGGRVRPMLETSTYALLCYGTSALVLLVACVVGRVEMWEFGLRGWLLIVAVTVAAQLLGHTVFNHLLATLSPTLVSMTVLLEVPGAALLAAVFLGQAPPTAVYAGLGLICAGLAIVVRSGSPAATPGALAVD